MDQGNYDHQMNPASLSHSLIYNTDTNETAITHFFCSDDFPVP